MESGLATHKVAELAAAAGVSLNIKALRHYTASQLLAGGIDLRNTAARLGHGSGGATTLRYYADAVSEVDRRAAAYLASLTATQPTNTVPPMPSAPRSDGRQADQIPRQGRNQCRRPASQFRRAILPADADKQQPSSIRTTSIAASVRRIRAISFPLSPP